MPLAAIRQPDVQAWVAELSARGFAPATVVKAYQLLGRTMTAAVNADMLPRSPCRAVRLPRIEREEMRFLDPGRGCPPGRCNRLALPGAGPARRLRRAAHRGAGRAAPASGRPAPGHRRCGRDRGRGPWPSSTPGRPRPAPVGASVGLPRSWWRSWPSTWGRSGDADAYVFTADQGGVLRASNFRTKVWLPAIRAAGLAPAASPRSSAHGGGAVDRRRGEPQGGQLSGPGIPRWRSPWTATATCSRATTTSCATAWTPCMSRVSRPFPPRRGGAAGGPAAARSRPQRGPRQAKQRTRPAVQRA